MEFLPLISRKLPVKYNEKFSKELKEVKDIIADNPEYSRKELSQVVDKINQIYQKSEILILELSFFGENDYWQSPEGKQNFEFNMYYLDSHKVPNELRFDIDGTGVCNHSMSGESYKQISIDDPLFADKFVHAIHQNNYEINPEQIKQVEGLINKTR